MILASMGYRVTASTGRPEEAAWLYKTVGVEEIINRSELASPGKPLQKEPRQPGGCKSWCGRI